MFLTRGVMGPGPFICLGKQKVLPFCASWSFIFAISPIALVPPHAVSYLKNKRSPPYGEKTIPWDGAGVAAGWPQRGHSVAGSGGRLGEPRFIAALSF